MPLEHSIFGVTAAGINLFDLKISVSATGYVCHERSIEDIDASLVNAKELLPILNKDVCRNFYAALNESDRMKQFLGYFQFIERYTHSTFKALSYNSDAKLAFNVPQRINKSASKFFEKIFADSKNLAQRFHWCAILAWPNIEESDVNNFLEAKRVRDRLSHGEHVEKSELPVAEIKRLALKILGAKQS